MSAKTTVWSGTSGDWSASGNWTNGVPDADDHVYFENNAQSVTTGFPSGTVNLGSLNIDQSYTGSLASAATGPLNLGIAELNIGYHNGPGTPAGAPSIYLNLGSAIACTITVSNTGTSADASRAPVRLYGSNASNTLTVKKGKVEFGTNTGDTTSALSALTVSYDTRVNTDADVFIGSGVTLTTTNIFGGDTVYECDCTTTNVHAGTLLAAGAWVGTTTFTSYGGTSTINSTGTITNCNIYGGTVDFTKTSGAKVITNMNLAKGGVLKFNSTGTTLSNGIMSLDVGQDTTYTAS